MAEADTTPTDEAPTEIESAQGGTRSFGMPVEPKDSWLWIPRRVLPLLIVTLIAIPLLHYGAHPRAFIAAFLLGVLGWLAVIDLETRTIPNRIVLPSMAIVLVANIAFYPDHTLQWVLAGVGAGVLMLIPQILRADAVGMGDVKLAALVGFGMGKQVVAALVLGLIATWPLALLLFWRQGREARGTAIPLAPFMAIGATLTVLLGGGAVV